MDNFEFLKRISLINDNTRLKILQIIAKNKTICACRILEELEITQGTLSHHMKLLVEAEIVYVRKEGKWSYYSLNNKKICELAIFLQSICKCDSDCQKP